MEVRVTLKSDRRTQPFKPIELLPFGKLRTDHMFVMDFINNEWKNAQIKPYGDLHIPPGASCLQYGQEIFEGIKAFEHSDGELYTFRIDENAKRINLSAKALCMPTITEEDFIQGVHSLLDIDRLWFPKQAGASMYIRPFMIGVSDVLSVSSASKYQFCVILSPSGPYYPKGFSAPGHLLITEKFHRAMPGGTGDVKAGGNYAASLRAGALAESLNANQVLYLDVTNTYVEEAGSMNHFHVTSDDTIHIPEFTDSILRSITSCTMKEIAKELNFSFVEEKIAIKDFIEGIEDKTIVEAGGFGTAASISPVGKYSLVNANDEVIETISLGQSSVGPISKKLYDQLTGIQRGLIKAPEGWLFKVKRNN
jgi:branched-chain amino acid aminotransferase